MIDLGGGVTVDVLNLGGHTENSVVFACAHYKALFTGDAIGSGYIVLMICPEKDMYKVLESYKKNLECFLPRAEALRDYAWFGGAFHSGKRLRRAAPAGLPCEQVGLL